MEPEPLVHLMEDVSLAEFAYDNPEFRPEPSEVNTNSTEKEKDTDIHKVFKFTDLDLYEREDLKEPNAFQKLRQSMKKVTADGSVMKKIEREGREDIPPYDSSEEKFVIKYYYAAYIEHCHMPFDLVIPRVQKPRMVTIGCQSIIPGLEIALKTMKRGEEASFLIKPKLAYRDGQPPKIPKQATILFVVNVNDIAVSIDDDEDEHPAFSRIRDTADALCDAGNAARKNGDNSRAIRKYRKAEAYLLNAVYENEEEEKDATKYLMRIYSNSAICYLDMNEYKKVCIAFNNAKYRDSALAYKQIKLLYNSAKALMKLRSYKEARKRLKIALRIEPNCKQISDELKQLDELEQGDRRKETELYKKMLNFEKMPEEVAEKETASFLNDNTDFAKELATILDQLSGSEGQVIDTTSFTNQEMEIVEQECRKKKVRIRKKNSQITLLKDES